MLNKVKSKLNSDTNLKELVSGSLITFVLKMGGMSLSYLMIYFIVQKTGSKGAGYYSLINNVLMILGMIAAMGTNVSVLRFVGQYNNEENNVRLGNLYSNLVKLALPIALILGAVIWFFSENIAVSIFRDIEYAPALALVGITLPFFTLDLIAVEFIRGLKKLKVSEFIRSVSRPTIVLICLFIVWFQDIENIYIIYFYCGAVILNSIASSATVIVNVLRIKDHQKALSTKEIFKVSSPMMITAITGILMSSTSIFLLEYFSTTEDVGVYSVAVRLSLLISLVLIVVNTISAPKFSELYWGKKMDELQKVIHQSVKLIFWGALFVAIVVGVGSYPILGIFGEEFTKGQLPLIILIIGQMVNAAAGSVALFLNMSGHQNVLRNMSLISLVIQLILALVLIPSMGMLGAAISSTAGGILWNILCILYVKSKLNIKTYYFPSL